MNKLGSLLLIDAQMAFSKSEVLRERQGPFVIMTDTCRKVDCKACCQIAKEHQEAGVAVMVRPWTSSSQHDRM